jgi:hypothetical protein
MIHCAAGNRGIAIRGPEVHMSEAENDDKTNARADIINMIEDRDIVCAILAAGKSEATITRTRGREN